MQLGLVVVGQGSPGEFDSGDEVEAVAGLLGGLLDDNVDDRPEDRQLVGGLHVPVTEDQVDGCGGVHPLILAQLSIWTGCEAESELMNFPNLPEVSVLILILGCRCAGSLPVGDTGSVVDTGDPHSTESNEDQDNDGYSAAEGDCDDGDPNISPSATDVVGDGIDQNCDGVDGYDGDGDGYASAGSGGDDCDDTDNALNLDDADGDTFTTCDGDCDDLDSALNLSDADKDGESSCSGAAMTTTMV